MPGQVHKTKQSQKSAEQEQEDSAPKSVTTNVDEDALDDLLDEIDECLGDLTDEEVQTFVSEYKQKGGQ